MYGQTGRQTHKQTQTDGYTGIHRWTGRQMNTWTGRKEDSNTDTVLRQADMLHPHGCPSPYSPYCDLCCASWASFSTGIVMLVVTMVTCHIQSIADLFLLLLFRQASSSSLRQPPLPVPLELLPVALTYTTAHHTQHMLNIAQT